MPAFRTTRRVEFRDTDMAGIMHFSAFFTVLESVEHEFLRSLGLSVVMSDEEGPLGWPRVSASCDFKGAVKFEDLLDIELLIARLGDKSVTYQFTVDHVGRRIAEGRIVAVCCRLTHGQPLQAIAIPAKIANQLSAYVRKGAIDNRESQP
jgi:4-hydroxybenzoyl-CoA thioesterase/acyl-CoA thioester hydrolase